MSYSVYNHINYSRFFGAALFPTDTSRVQSSLESKVVVSSIILGVSMFYDVNATAAFTLTLPPLPLDGASLIIANTNNSFGTFQCTLGRNGKFINGLSFDKVLDIAGGVYECIFSKTANGWVVVNLNAGSSIPSLSLGNIFIGNSSSVATERTLTGDATLSDIGVLSLNPSTVQNSKLSAAATLTKLTLYCHLVWS